MKRAALAVLIAFAATVPACGGGDDPRPSGDARAPAEPGTKLHEVRAAGFSIRLPETWTAVRDTAALDEALAGFSEENPELEAYIRAVVENDVIDFFAFDPDVERDFATNVNVLRFPVEGSPSFERWSGDVIAEIEALPTRTGELRRAREELPAGEALRLQYRNRFRAGASEFVVSTLQYVFVSNGEAYVVTFSTLPAREDEYREVFAAAARSFRLTA